MYTYRIGLIPGDSAKNISKVCKRYGCELNYAGWEDGMSDVYIESDEIKKIEQVARNSWFRFDHGFIYNDSTGHYLYEG